MASKPTNGKARKRPKKTAEPKKMGRPSSFSERLAERLLNMAAKGATDVEMAEAAGIGVSTFKAWKGRHEDFRAALKEAKDVADELVEASLYRRANGYSHRAIKFFCHEGMILSEEYDEHYPPDTTACIFWLKNRQRERWRDKQEVESTIKADETLHSMLVRVMEKVRSE